LAASIASFDIYIIVASRNSSTVLKKYFKDFNYFKSTIYTTNVNAPAATSKIAHNPNALR